MSNEQRRSSGFLVGAILLIVLSWRGAGGALRVANELNRPFDDLRTGLVGSLEDRLRTTARGDYPVLRAVLDHVPAGEPLFLVGELDLEQQLAKSTASIRAKAVYSLLYALAPAPAHIVPPSLVAATVSGYTGPQRPWAVDLHAEIDFEWDAFFEAVERGADFTLWRWKERSQ